MMRTTIVCLGVTSISFKELHVLYIKLAQAAQSARLFPEVTDSNF